MPAQKFIRYVPVKLLWELGQIVHINIIISSYDMRKRKFGRKQGDEKSFVRIIFSKHKIIFIFYLTAYNPYFKNPDRATLVY